MSNPRAALASLLYEHAKTGRSCIGCAGCPNTEFMNGHQHAEHVADLFAREYVLVPRTRIDRDSIPDDKAEWWTPSMRTPMGRWIREMFEHPCDGMPYSEDGYDDRGPIITVRNLLRSVRMAELEVGGHE